jgi:hypothetical protein
MTALTATTTTAADLVPFVHPWDDASEGPTNIADWLHTPAGKYGFARAESDGHFYVGDHRLRMFGVNLCFGACFPEKDDAEKIAARMAKFGINAVRFHHMDMRTFPNGIRSEKSGDTRALSPEALDRLDYLIAQLKSHGIYTNLNLLVSRPFNSADGFPDAMDELAWKDTHIVGFFNDRSQELQEEYARKLLTHWNPYTESTYVDDPSVAIVEINNENGLIHSWLGGKVDALPEVFRADLRAQWNAWLSARYDGSKGLRAAWGVKAEPVGDELLANPDFSHGASAWNVERHGAAAASVDSDSGALRIAVTQPSSQAWHVQVNQGGISLDADRPYTLTVRARSDVETAASVAIGQAHDPWQSLGFTSALSLAPEWKTFTFVVSLTGADDNARVNISNLGDEVATVWIDEVSLRPGGVVGIREGESVEESSVPLFARANVGERTAGAADDWMRFLWETERAYWQRMYRYIKDDLGVRAPVVGTIVGNAPANLMAELDAVDTHAYWRHPSFPGRPWDSENWTVDNVSMVTEPGGALAGLAKRRVEGKPHLCTEYNHAAPGTYSAEAPLLLAAIAALQDWDGVFLFSYSHRQDDWETNRIPNFFDIDRHPPKMANMISSAALFHRADLRPAEGEVVVGLTPDREIELLRREGRAWNLVHAGTLGVDNDTTIRHRVAIRAGASGDGSTPDGAPDRADGPLQSDTGEFTWDASTEGRERVVIDTPRTKSVIGFTDGDAFDLGAVTIRPGVTRQGWSTISVTLMEGEGFGEAGSVLIAATGDVENTNMGWKDATRTSVGRNWGEAPSLVEAVTASVSFAVGSHRVSAWALDERGQRAEEVDVVSEDGHARLQLGPPHRTLWYEVEIR